MTGLLGLHINRYLYLRYLGKCKELPEGSQNKSPDGHCQPVRVRSHRFPTIRLQQQCLSDSVTYIQYILDANCRLDPPCGKLLRPYSDALALHPSQKDNSIHQICFYIDESFIA